MLAAKVAGPRVIGGMALGPDRCTDLGLCQWAFPFQTGHGMGKEGLGATPP